MRFGQNRRQENKRQEGSDGTTPADQENRQKAQRRQYFRVVYPPTVAPEIVNIPAQVVDVSVKAVKFLIAESVAQKFNLNHGDKAKMALKFRDGLVIDVAGIVLRQEVDASGKKVYICIFDQEIPSAIINDEQLYLLKNFPDFCREKFGVME